MDVEPDSECACGHAYEEHTSMGDCTRGGCECLGFEFGHDSSEEERDAMEDGK